ncbi:MAG: hypothetical protein Q9212_006855 [Teloschistes hypoglaucus]
MDERSNKRRRISIEISDEEDEPSGIVESTPEAWASAKQKRTPGDKKGAHNRSRAPISPPPTRRSVPNPCTDHVINHLRKDEALPEHNPRQAKTDQYPNAVPLMASPIQLSTVNGLPTTHNVDTVSLQNILGDPLIEECWLFNYLIDVDFIMSQLDEDVRDEVRVHIVHGSWQKENSNRVQIEEAAKKYANVQVVIAYMAEMYGTHHSKMIILFRRDQHAQINIMTGNFIVGDWSMCQAIWRSPLLPIQSNPPQSDSSPKPHPVGRGLRFKDDFLAYLESYGRNKSGTLVKKLQTFDFSAVRAALIASVPGRQNIRTTDPGRETLFGWPALRHILSSIKSASPTSKPHIVMQCSSVASIGEKWMKDTFLKALSPTPSLPPQRPKFSLVFPTADEIRRSVDGYASGGSIHMKTQHPAQKKQLAYLKPALCHWAGDHEQQPSEYVPTVNGPPLRQALRRRAAPHIKTYIRFSDQAMTKVDWAIMTSANLSKQAWGEAADATGHVRICSYEIGVVVWPALWEDDEGGIAEMVPVFGKDMPATTSSSDPAIKSTHHARKSREVEEEELYVNEEEETTDEEGGKGIRDQDKKDKEKAKVKGKIGLRIPYDLPLIPYANEEMPWCASTPCMEPDWAGRHWPGFGGS